MWLKALRLFIAVSLCPALLSGQQAPATVPSTDVVPHTLSLFEAEQLLINRNLLLSASRSNLAASEAARHVAAFKPNPQLQFGMEQVPFQSPVPGSVPRFFATNGNAGANPVYTAQFSKLFERGGKRESRIKQADAQVNAASATISDTLRNQLFALRQAFGNAVLARENLRLAEEMDSQYSHTEDLMAIRVKAGDLPGIELYRLQAGRLQFQQAVLDAQNAYEQSTHDILNVLSAKVENVAPDANARPTGNQTSLLPSAPLEVVGDFVDFPVADSLSQLKEIAHNSRPDLKVARSNFDATNYGVRLAQAQRSHDVNIATEYQRVGDDDTLGIVSQIPLFLYNNGKPGVEQAQALRRVAEAQLHQAEIQVDTDVEKAYHSWLAAKRSVALYSGANLQQVQKVRDIVEFSYQHGAATVLELLDAERTLRQATTAYNQARGSYQLSLWQLEQALGKDLQ
jgi:cobalt-zinc-cadmium efflux system outer membrane protein